MTRTAVAGVRLLASPMRHPHLRQFDRRERASILRAFCKWKVRRALFMAEVACLALWLGWLGVGLLVAWANDAEMIDLSVVPLYVVYMCGPGGPLALAACLLLYLTLRRRAINRALHDAAGSGECLRCGYPLASISRGELSVVCPECALWQLAAVQGSSAGTSDKGG